MKKDKGNEMKGLLDYEEDSGGGIMSREFMCLKWSRGVKEGLIEVKEEGGDGERIYVILGVNEDEEVVGVVWVRDVIVGENDG